MEMLIYQQRPLVSMISLICQEPDVHACDRKPERLLSILGVIVEEWEPTPKDSVAVCAQSTLQDL